MGRKSAGEKGRMRHYFQKPTRSLGPTDYRRLVNDFGGIPSLLRSQQGRDYLGYLIRQSQVHRRLKNGEITELVFALADLDPATAETPLSTYVAATIANILAGSSEHRGEAMKTVGRKALEIKNRFLSHLIAEYPRDVSVTDDARRPEYVILGLIGHGVFGLHMPRSAARAILSSPTE